MTTDTEITTDLKIDAFEYARKYRELDALGTKIVEESKGLGLSKLVFFDGLEHFTLITPYNSELLKVVPLTCIEEEPEPATE